MLTRRSSATRAAVPPEEIARLDRQYRFTNHDIKFFYTALLLELPLQDVRDFFGAQGLAFDGRQWSEAGLLRHIWDERATSPMRINMEIVCALEPFLVSRGVEFWPLLLRSYVHLGKGTAFPPDHILWTFRRVIHWFYRGMDPREVICRFVRGITAQAHPNTVQIPLRRYTAGGLRYCIFAYYPRRASDWDLLPPLEAGPFVACRLAQAPQRFGGRPFDGWQMLCERIDACSQAPWGSSARLQDGIFFVDGERCGRTVTFDEVLERERVRLPRGVRVANRPVVLMERDCFCPVRKRVALSAGCAYGAPIYLYRLCYRPDGRKRSRASLEELIAENLNGPGPLWQEAARWHEQLLRLIEGPAEHEFAYDRSAGEIRYNGDVVCSGGPAALLAALLRQHNATGRTVFARRDLLYDPSVCPDRKRPNLEVRMARLAGRLARICAPVSVEKSGRAAYRLVVHGRTRLIAA